VPILLDQPVIAAAEHFFEQGGNHGRLSARDRKKILKILAQPGEPGWRE
jgi:hypothetical protein